MKYKYRFSIFTPTYNRGHLLEKLYNDLKKQTFKDFEWIVIGDKGCTDNTDEVMANLISRNELNIVYVKREKKGLHEAYKLATKLFQGEYVVRCDDDDSRPSDCLEIFNRYWKELEKRKDFDRIWEIRGRCIYENGSLVGKEFCESHFLSDYNEVNYKLKFGTIEMESSFKTDILRGDAAVPTSFPYDNKVINYPEHLRWSHAARKYKTLFISDIVRYYNYTQGSLSYGAKELKGPVPKERLYTTLVSSIGELNEMRDLIFKYRLIDYFVNIYFISVNDFYLHEKSKKYLKYPLDKITLFFCYPFANILEFIRKHTNFNIHLTSIRGLKNHDSTPDYPNG